jgi:rhodanese-related sulfurtransferase
MRSTALLLALAVLSGCQSDPSTDRSAAPVPEQARVVTAIAALDSMRIARAATITADETVDAETFARVCKPVGLRARDLSEDNGWTVRQIATRYRNPANAAAPEDSALFAQFEADPGLTDHWIDAVHDGVSGQRYLRRITVQASCLTCHGPRDERPAFVVASYPEDRAVGFEPGDLRGLYSVFVPDSVDAARGARSPSSVHSPIQPPNVMSFLSRLMGTPATNADDALSPAEFVAQRDPEAPVIDVRTPAEFRNGHLDGAVNVDIFEPDFQQQIEALDLPDAGPVYLYCRSGNRSGKAAQILRQMGHEGAVNVGGFEALKAAGAPTN